MQVSTELSRSKNSFDGKAAPDPSALLTDVRYALARVVHDVNNPLTIIAGNAQLLGELSRMMELDPDLAKPISDIEEASQQLAERMAQLAELKESVLAALDGQDDRI